MESVITVSHLIGGQLMTGYKPQDTALRSWWGEYEEKLVAEGTHRVELFIKSHMPAPGAHGRRNRLLKELEAHSKEGAIDRYDLTVLDDKFCLCEPCRKLHHSTGLLERVEELMSWRSGGICSIGFTRQNVHSSVLEEEYTVIVPPETALGIYVGESLVGVFPCMAAGINFRPEKYFEELAEKTRAEIVE